MTRTRLRALAALGLAATVLLTGCNAVPGFNPGVAARVDDATVSLRTVDDVTASLCEYAEPQLQDGQAIPMRYLRSQVASSLALRLAADEFAAGLDVTAGSAYDDAVAQAEASLAELPDEQVKAVIDVQGASTYVAAIEQAAGAELAPDAGAQAQAAAGQKAFQEWLADNDIAMDPRFGVTIDSGAATPADTSLSFPAGEIAGLADAEQPDADFAAGLPETQRCG